MPTCEICGEELDEVYVCKICGYKFCADCGDAADEVCEYCGEEEEL